MLRSIGVVLGSYILSVVLVLCTDPLLMRIFPSYVRGQIPANNVLMTSTGLFIAISILCAFLCAKLSAQNPGKHVLWFFVLGEVMGIVSIIPNWGKGWPHWYWLSWLLSWPVSCWIGAKLGGRKGLSQSTVTT